jgi:hypothetical protein
VLLSPRQTALREVDACARGVPGLVCQRAKPRVCPTIRACGGKERLAASVEPSQPNQKAKHAIIGNHRNQRRPWSLRRCHFLGLVLGLSRQGWDALQAWIVHHGDGARHCTSGRGISRGDTCASDYRHVMFAKVWQYWMNVLLSDTGLVFLVDPSPGLRPKLRSRPLHL